MAQKVLALAKKHEAEGKGYWSACSIQKRGWPDEKPYQACKLGIAKAIRELKRRVRIYSVNRGGYRTVN